MWIADPQFSKHPDPPDRPDDAFNVAPPQERAKQSDKFQNPTDICKPSSADVFDRGRRIELGKMFVDLWFLYDSSILHISIPGPLLFNIATSKHRWHMPPSRRSGRRLGASETGGLSFELQGSMFGLGVWDFRVFGLRALGLLA